MQDQQLAEHLAQQAGELLLRVRSETGATGRALGDRGDRLADDFLLEQMARLRPEDKVLSEESADDPSRIDADRVWIIDPVDGTREFAHPPRRDWAVHVALWERRADPSTAQLSAAAVSLPAAGVVLGTNGARRFSGEPLPLTARRGGDNQTGVGEDTALLAPRNAGGSIRIVASGSRPPAFLAGVVSSLGAEQLSVGSAGAKAMCVVRGEADAYIHAGGQYQWDSAAPVGVALAHGFAACRIDGSALQYNKRETYLPDLIVCRNELRDEIVEAIAKHKAEG